MNWFKRHITLEGAFWILFGGLVAALLLLGWVMYNIWTVA